MHHVIQSHQERLGPDTLLNLSCRAVAIRLGFDCDNRIDVGDLIEPEIALKVWRAYEALSNWQCRTLKCWDRQILSKFSCLWSIRVLRLTHRVPHTYVNALQLVRGTLEHLEVFTSATHLQWLTGFNKLTCLSLLGENIHPLALGALAGLPSLCSLDLRGMRQLSDSTSVGPVLASLASLEHLDLGDTSLGDGIIESLTYGRRAANWHRQSRAPGSANRQVRSVHDIPGEPVGRQGVSAEARWPELQIRTLVLHGTRVTTACLANLAALAELQYLDMRKTAVQRKDLIGLENRLGLHAQHGGAVLSISAGMALLVQQFRPKLCQCNLTVGNSELERWEQESIRKLVYSQ
ncbi:g4795 [Coccomyxa elongata]